MKITLAVEVESGYGDVESTVRVAEIGLSLDEVYSRLKAAMRETGALATEDPPMKIKIGNGPAMTLDEYNAVVDKQARP